MAAGFIKLAILISASSRGMRAYKDAADGTNRWAAAISKVGVELTLLGAILAIDFAKAALTAFAEFEHGMAKIIAIVDASDAQIKKFRGTIRDLARETIFTANQTVDAAFFLVQAGLDVTEAIGALPHVLNLAKIGMVELGTASDIVTDIMRALGLQEGELGFLTDQLVFTYSRFNTTIEQLGSAFSYVAPLARILGEEQNVLAAAIGNLSSAGIKGERAGTALRNIFTKLINPSMEANRVLQELGVTVFDNQNQFVGLIKILEQFRDAGATATDVMQVFQMRAGPAFLALMNAIEGDSKALKEFSAELLNVGGFAEEAGDKIEQSAMSKFLQFQSKMTDFLITAGAELMPLAEELMGAIFPEGAEGKSPLLESFIEFMKALIPLLIAITPIIVMFVTTFAKIIQFIAALGPGLQVVLAIAGAVAVFAGVISGIIPIFLTVIFVVGTIIMLFKDWAGWIDRVNEGFDRIQGWYDDKMPTWLGGGEKRQMGGLIRRSGMYHLEQGEEVINPRAGQAPGQFAGGPSGKGQMSITNNYYVTNPATAMMQERENRKYMRRLAYR